MRFKLVLSLLILVLFASSARAATVYVDSVSGSDSNTTNAAYPCGSLCGPYQTLQFVSHSVALAAGGILALKRGSVFRPNSSSVLGLDSVFKPNQGGQGWCGTTTNPCYITSYGYGQPPMIDGDECVGSSTGLCAGQTSVAGTWSVLSGSIYEATLSAATRNPLFVFINSELSPPVLVSATCQTGTCTSIPHGATSPVPASALPFWQTSFAYSSGDAVQSAGMWYTCSTAGTSSGSAPSCLTGTCGTGAVFTPHGKNSGTVLAMVPGSWSWDGTNLYVWMPGNDTPANHSVEISDTTAAVHIVANGAEQNGEVWSGITIRGGGDNIAQTSSGSGGSAGSYTFQNMTFDQAGAGGTDDGQDWANAHINGGGGGTNGTGWVFKNNRFLYGSKANLSVECTTGTVVEGNEVRGGQHGSINFRQACSGDGAGHQIIGNIVDIGIHGLSSLGAPTGIYVEHFDTPGVIANNYVFANDDPGGCVNSGQSVCADAIALFEPGPTGNVSILNNITDGNLNGMDIDTNCGTLTVRNNIFSTSNSANSTINGGFWGLPLQFSSFGGNPTCTGGFTGFDYNDYNTGNTSTGNVVYFNGAKSLAAYQTATGAESHSVQTDPINILSRADYLSLKHTEYWVMDQTFSVSIGAHQ